MVSGGFCIVLGGVSAGHCRVSGELFGVSGGLCEVSGDPRWALQGLRWAL